jgi:hypothetical protein
MSLFSMASMRRHIRDGVSSMAAILEGDRSRCSASFEAPRTANRDLPRDRVPVSENGAEKLKVVAKFIDWCLWTKSRMKNILVDTDQKSCIRSISISY